MIKNTKIKTVESGQYRFSFRWNPSRIAKGDCRGTCLNISTIGAGGTWSIVISGDTHAFGYLFAAMNRGDNGQLEGYASLLWSLSMLITTDQPLAEDITKAIAKWNKRKMKAAGSAAKSVTEEENDADQALMESIINER